MEKPEEKMKEESFFKKNRKFFFWEALMFALILGLGIVAALRISPPDPVPLWRVLLAFFLSTAFILLITRLGKSKTGTGRGAGAKAVFFKLIFILAVFAGASQVLSALMPDMIALILTAILIFCWLKKRIVLIHNLAIILGLSGITAFLGLSLGPETVIALLIILSLYDFVAVYKTKHMVKMAQEMMSARAILALIVPRELADLKTDLKEIRPGGNLLIIGGGDMAFPLLLCISLLPQGITGPLIVAAFALLGIFTSFYLFISQRVRRPIPALPPIALFSIIGFLVYRLFVI